MYNLSIYLANSDNIHLISNEYFQPLIFPQGFRAAYCKRHKAYER